MLKMLLKWTRKTVSDAHSAIVGLILLSALPLLYVYADQILNQIAKALNQSLPMWVTVSVALTILLICLLFLRKTLSTPKIRMIETKEESEEIITEMHDKILSLLFSKSLTIETICKTLQLNKEEAKYYLFDLYNKNMAYPPAPYSSNNEWYISQGGRTYVMSKRTSA